MKTLFIDGISFYYPILKSISNILEEVVPLLAENYKVILTVPKDVDELKLKQLHVSDVVFISKKLNKEYSVLDFIYNYLPEVSKAIEKYIPDYFWNPLTYFNKRLSKNKTKVFTTIHDLFPLHPLSKRPIHRKFVFKMLLKQTLKNVDGVFVPSAFTQSLLEVYFPREIGKTRLKVIYNGISMTNKEPNVAEIELPKDYLFFLGRLSYWKGTDILLDLYEKIKYTDFPLVIAGKIDDGSLKKRIYNLSKNNPNVIYKGFVTEDEKELLYKRCKIFVYPSRFDGFGIPPLEAAIRKKPVITSNIPVMYEVTQGKGLYFDVNMGAKSLYRTLKTLKNEDMERIVKDLYFVASQYTWERYVEQLIEFLEGNN